MGLFCFKFLYKKLSSHQGLSNAKKIIGLLGYAKKMYTTHPCYLTLPYWVTDKLLKNRQIIKKPTNYWRTDKLLKNRQIVEKPTNYWKTDKLLKNRHIIEKPTQQTKQKLWNTIQTFPKLTFLIPTFF